MGRPRRPARQEEAQLIARAQEGDRAAWMCLYRQYVGELFGYCYNELGDAQDAEDVVSESFLRAVRGLDRFDGRSSFRTWIYTIARNQMRDGWRRAGRRPRTVALAEARAEADRSDHASEDNEQPSGRATRLGQAMLDALPERYAAVLRMRVMEGRSLRDTAEAMGTTPGNVKVLQHRALKRARSIAEQWEREQATVAGPPTIVRTIPAGGAQ